jgi:hypothetical protein
MAIAIFTTRIISITWLFRAPPPVMAGDAKLQIKMEMRNVETGAGPATGPGFWSDT